MTNRWIRRISLATIALGLLALNVASSSRAEEKGGNAMDAVMLKSDIAFLEEGLKGTPPNRAVFPLKATAMLIAQYAQNSENYSLRDQAMKVAKLIGDKKYAEARTEVGKLADAKGGSGKKVNLAQEARFDIEELMTLFKPSRRSGRNLEVDIVQKYSKVIPDTKAAGEVGARVAVIADYTHDLRVPRASGAKQKEWEDLSKQMKELGLKIAAESMKDKPSKGQMIKDFKALDANCTACHNEFR